MHKNNMKTRGIPGNIYLIFTHIFFELFDVVLFAGLLSQGIPEDVFSQCTAPLSPGNLWVFKSIDNGF
jgi:hypothetical protein